MKSNPVKIKENTITTYKDFLGLKQYAKTTIKVYLRMQKLFGNNNTQTNVNRFLLNHRYKSARAFLKSYVWDYLHLNKEIDIQKISGRQKKLITLERVLNDEDYEKLVNALPLKLSVMCRLLKEAAMRMNEMLMIGSGEGDLEVDNDINPIKINWVDDEGNHNYIDLISGKIVWFGKGRRQAMGWLSNETVALIIKLIEQENFNDTSPSLFGIKRSCFHKRLSQHSKIILGYHVTSHWFKRTMGRWLEDQGFDLEERQQYLHHSDPKTTQLHYSFKQGRQVFDKVKELIR